jgi:hypothetical protein
MPALPGSQLLRLARRAADDTVTPYFTSDADFFMFLAAAEEEFARETRCLREVVTVNVAAGEPRILYTSFPPLVEIRSAAIVSPRYAQLKVVGSLAGSADNVLARRSGVPGQPREVVKGRSKSFIELVPTPDVDYTLEFDVIHLPTEPISGNSSYPEIPEEWHMYLPLGAAHLAMKEVEDEEYFNPQRYEAIVGKWASILMQATARITGASDDAATMPFHGNDLWIQD